MLQGLVQGLVVALLLPLAAAQGIGEEKNSAAVCVSDDIRLVDGTSPLEGRVEVCSGEQWGSVCDEAWNYQDAIVVCRQLGHNTLGARAIGAAFFGQSTGNIVLTEVMCYGNETTLTDCPHSTAPGVCGHDDDAGVRCETSGFTGNCIDNDVRLVDGMGPLEGRVELCANGLWGRVCADSWNYIDAIVVCRQLGQPLGAIALPVSGGARRQANLNNIPVHLNLFVCDGTEQQLVDCPLSPFAVPNDIVCSNDFGDAMAICQPPSFEAECNESAIRLVSSATPTQIDFPPETGLQTLHVLSEGRVEVCVNGLWGAVCRTGWGSTDGSVACRQLGLTLGDIRFRRNGGILYIPLNQVDCTGAESMLTSCLAIPPFFECRTIVDLRCDIFPCSFFVCPNGGTCFESSHMPACLCAPGFTGTFCTTAICLPDSCQNGGMCPQGGAANGSACSCLPGFSGMMCEQDLDFCQPSTCENGGTCLEDVGPAITCACAPGYTGPTCETDLDYCLPSACRNGGTCVEGPGRSTSCLCPQDITGPMCSAPIEAPSPAPSVPCPAEVDMSWMLSYAETQPGETVMHQCSEISAALVGEVRRQCLGDGEWGAVDTSSCQSEEILRISVSAQSIFSGATVDSGEVALLLGNLTEATAVEGPSLFPMDLQATNHILNTTVDYLLEDLAANPDRPAPFTLAPLDVANNLLVSSNAPGWQLIPPNEVGSELLLSNVENYGQYFAEALMNVNVNISEDISQTMSVTRDNILLQAEFVDSRDVDAVLFPLGIDPNQNSSFGAESILTREFLIARGASDSNISVVNIRIDNLNSFLPEDGLNSTQRPSTTAISTQLFNGNRSTMTSVIADSQAIFRFTTKMFPDDVTATNPQCAFFAFGDDLADSSWSTEGLTTEVTSSDEGTFDVICKSPHLTSFAVLLDVNNALSEVETRVLTVITYVGCSISIVFLIVTILFLVIMIGREMFTSVHYFIHLNLSIALLLGYVVFLAGVDTAGGNRIGCAFVAALLHYLFTAVFCWMLCEGIMLYLMLVVVFSTISKKWWLFLLLGWVPPVFIVAISVGIIHDQYGSADYCWISVESNGVWAFAVPMLFVILVNTFFLGAALWSLFKLSRDKMEKFEKYSKVDKKTQFLFKKLLVATFVLLPLLGLTWVFGLLSVNQQTTFFAWIFTILNSLQGLFIFIFHVLRSEKVWNKIKATSSGTQSTGVAGSKNRRGGVSRLAKNPLPAAVKGGNSNVNQGEELIDVDMSMFEEKKDKNIGDAEEHIGGIDGDLWNCS